MTEKLVLKVPRTFILNSRTARVEKQSEIYQYSIIYRFFSIEHHCVEYGRRANNEESLHFIYVNRKKITSNA